MLSWLFTAFTSVNRHLNHFLKTAAWRTKTNILTTLGVKKEDAVEKKVGGGNKFWEPWIAKGKVVTPPTPIILLKWIESIFQDIWGIWEGIIFNQDVYNNYLDYLHSPFLPF